MKVDSGGKPISEGTAGLYEGYSAIVERTYANPIEDSAEVQKGLAKGGFIVKCAGGETYCNPSDFIVDDKPNQVTAQDGQRVEVGDKIEYGKGEKGTVNSVWPTSDIRGGQFCCSIKEKDGRAPDGKLGIGHGGVAKVIKKGVEETLTTKTGDVIKVGDQVECLYENVKHPGVVLRLVGIRDTNTGLMTPANEAAEELFTAKSWNEGAAGHPFTAKTWLGRKISGEEGEGEDEVGVEDLEIGDQVEFLDDYGKESAGEVVDLKAVAAGSWDFTVALTATKSEQLKEDVAKENPGDRRYYVKKANVTKVTRKGESEMSDAKQGAALTPKQISQKFGKVGVEREGTMIVLPAAMNLRTAIAELTRQAEQEDMDVNIMEIIPGFPLDAAYAFVKALEQKYGWVNSLPTPGFFGPKPPTMIGVEIDANGGTVQIPWGRLGIPGLRGFLSTGIQFVDKKPNFCVGGTVKQGDKLLVNELVTMARRYLEQNSLYRGKAIRVKFPTTEGEFNPMDNQPKFMRVADVKAEELIFSAEVGALVNVNLWTVIECLNAVRAAKIPVKRGILAYGKYGVGKTLLATVTAQKCVRSGVTFIDLVDSAQLPQAVQFARTLGGPVCIFAEDIDRCDENGTRTDAFNEILNTVDGLTSKNDEVITVMTTNHIERISPAMLRPGRLDAVIEVHPPDAEAVQRLIRLYARHMLDPRADIFEVGRELAGEIPAVVREVVERSKLASISRGDVDHITPEDLMVSARGMKQHLALLKEKPRDDRSELEKAGDAIGKRIAASLGATIGEAFDQDTDVRGAVETQVTDTTREIAGRKIA